MYTINSLIEECTYKIYIIYFRVSYDTKLDLINVCTLLLKIACIIDL